MLKSKIDQGLLNTPEYCKIWFINVYAWRDDRSSTLRGREIVVQNPFDSFTVSWSDPLYITMKSKSILVAAIRRDATFLQTNDVMDYSMLVGQCNESRTLFLGIIGKLYLNTKIIGASIIRTTE